MSEAYRALEARFARMSHLGGALSILQWDHQVMMPPGASPGNVSDSISK